jgi:hypothetical protein
MSDRNNHSKPHRNRSTRSRDIPLPIPALYRAIARPSNPSGDAYYSPLFMYTRQISLPGLDRAVRANRKSHAVQAPIQLTLAPLSPCDQLLYLARVKSVPHWISITDCSGPCFGQSLPIFRKKSSVPNAIKNFGALEYLF